MEAAISQPPVYTRAHNFSDFSAANPDTPQPGVWIDDELNAAKLTLDALRANIALLQKDDGSLFNGLVTYDSLSAATKAMLGSSNTPRGNWITATSYAVLDLVTHSGATYVCVTAHTSGTFATDLAAFKWLLFAGSTSSGDMTTLDFTTLTEDTNPDLSNDFLLSYDASGAANKKVKPVNLLSAFTSLYVATVGGTANAITLTPSPAIAAYAAGQKFSFVAPSNNTSTVSLAVSSLAAKNIKKVIAKSIVSLVQGDISAGKSVDCMYDGTQFILMSPRSCNQGAAIASATTTVLTGATGDFVHITGTTTITAVTMDQGQEMTLTFDDVLTFTNGGSLILPGAANITTAAGDSCVLRGEASSVVRCVSYTRADGTPLGGASDTFATKLLHIQDQKTSTTAGGTFTSGAWRTRDLNTVLKNNITSASLSANQISLPAGTYFILANVPGHQVSGHQSRLYNTTDSAVVLTGTPETCPTSTQTRSLLNGTFTLSGTKVLEIQHQCSTTQSTNGLGQSSPFTTGIFTEAMIWRTA